LLGIVEGVWKGSVNQLYVTADVLLHPNGDYYMMNLPLGVVASEPLNREGMSDII
jgi:hypothetical protein